MSIFSKKKGTETINLAGGTAYMESEELQLVSLLLTSFGDDKYYEKHSDVFSRLDGLIGACDKLFCAKAIVFARKQYGMRTITHYATSVLARYIGGEPWARDFFRSVVNRPDDMTEIIACHLGRKQKVTNAMRKGFAAAIGGFDGYALAKYRGEGKEVKLVDVVNMCHPKETAKTAGAITKLVNGELKSFDTWENDMSAAGSDENAKKEVWRRLLDENKLGYFALLRNLRNILKFHDDYLKKSALEALVDENAIRKSLVLPFRFLKAYNELSRIDSDALRSVSRACEKACSNVPRFSGKTLVALDVSGSMTQMVGNTRVSDIAALFAAVLVKSNDCDIITFADEAKYVIVNPDDSVMTIKGSIPFRSGGTNFIDVFKVAKKKYDRVILLSDMQAWVPDVYYSPVTAYRAYKKKYSPDCKLYSFDLAGYGTLQLPEKDVYCLAGFSEKVFDLMKFFEEDKNALISAIEAVEL